MVGHGFHGHLPEGWTVGTARLRPQPRQGDEFGFYVVVVDAIYADAGEGDTGELMHPSSQDRQPVDSSPADSNSRSRPKGVHSTNPDEGWPLTSILTR